MPTTPDNIITTREQLFSLPSGSFVTVDGMESGRIVKSLQYSTMFYSYQAFSGNYAYGITKNEFPEILTAKFELLWSPPQS